jgi:hypothetical protein
VVISDAWVELKKITKISIDIHHFSDIANLWNHDKNFKIANKIHAALLRVIWLMRNDMCFNRTNWSGMQIIWRTLAWLLAQWEVLLPVGKKRSLQVVIVQLEELDHVPPMLLWPELG